MLQQLLQAWFPFLALVAAWLTFVAFVRHKTKDIKTPLPAEIPRPVDSITIARRADSTNILRTYQVLIDGNVVGTVAAGAVAHFSVKPGSHAVAIKVDWCRTPDLHLEKLDTDNVLLWCGATYNDWRCTFMGFMRPERYIYVRHPNASDA